MRQRIRLPTLGLPESCGVADCAATINVHVLREDQNNCVLYTYQVPNNCALRWASPVTLTTVLVTSCTQRKSVKGGIDLAQLSQVHKIERLAEAWQRLASQALPAGPAKSLYQGRSITDTAVAASHLGASWFVVSAGLGLIRSDQQVPAYECTVAAGSELSCRLKLSGATATHWWNTITASQPIRLPRLIRESYTLLALPGSYLRLIYDDLVRVSAAEAGQLRIFTSTAGSQFVPKHLADCVMPYDDRLESIRSYAGTQSDFAQRALRHFVEALGATPLPLEAARDSVSTALAHRQGRPRSVGTRMSDDDIRRVLTVQWTRHAGSSTRLLRYLRDEASISCEQKRFGRLWRALAAELQAGDMACR